MRLPPCPNRECSDHSGVSIIIRYGFFRLKRGERRRYRCSRCGRTFCTTTATVYHGLQCSRQTFDEVCSLSVEGVTKAAIARIKRIAWNTVDRWLHRAAAVAGRFNTRFCQGFVLQELQADEIRTFMDSKQKPVYIIAAIEVWSRLWPACVVGRRSYRNIRRLLANVLAGADFEGPPLITTDGFAPYRWAIRKLLGPACIYGQVIKTRRKDRIVRVDRKLLIGSEQMLTDALSRSEDSETLNTSFIERHNLTLRRSCSYLHRRTPGHARWAPRLIEHLELVRCHYNFIRPHMALKFGTLLKTPAMQAGLMSRKLTFRQIFTSGVARHILFVLVISADWNAQKRLAA